MFRAFGDLFSIVVSLTCTCIALGGFRFLFIVIPDFKANTPARHCEERSNLLLPLKLLKISLPL